MSSTPKRMWLCLNSQGREFYVTYYPDSNKLVEREVPITERLIAPSLIVSIYPLKEAGDVIFTYRKTGKSKEVTYIYQTVSSLKMQIDSLCKLIQSGAAQWFKQALIAGIEKTILLRVRTRTLELTPEVEKQYSVFQKCVALLSSDKVGEMESAFNKAVLIGMKLINK